MNLVFTHHVHNRAAAPAPAPARVARRKRAQAPPKKTLSPSPSSPETFWDSVLIGTPTIEVEPFYRVLLHYSQWTSGESIARIVRFAVPMVSMNEAVRIVSMAESYETSIVVTVKKEEAELYAQRLLVAGLKSSTEVA